VLTTGSCGAQPETAAAVGWGPHRLIGQLIRSGERILTSPSVPFSASLARTSCCFLFGAVVVMSPGQTVLTGARAEASAQGKTQWTADWISDPTASLRDPGVFHFRKIIQLDKKPEHFPVEVSGDNRFILFVNGTRVGEGPAKGDLPHWRYESFDLAPALHAGENVIAATVWNFGTYAPLAVMGDRTAFLMQGESDAESTVNTDATWEVEQDPGQTFIPRVANGFYFYWAADPGEKLDGSLYDWGWDQAGSSSHSHWVHAAGAMRESIYASDNRALSAGRESHNRWSLVSDTLPQMEFREVAAGRVVRSDVAGAERFPLQPITIPAGSAIELLLDASTMVSGFPELEVSGGKGAAIRIGYTEALYDEHQKRGNRDEVADRQVRGQFDEFRPDGGGARRFTPLWFRTWRYLQLKITTAQSPLTLDGLHVYFNAYPFQERARFASNDPELEKIWDICWRTARLGARETYMDTPFWEQLQYVDDTRIQSLISYTVAGDDTLARQALHAFDDSRVPNGLTQSRYPSLLPQFIPNFSLSYINMLHDYWMYRPQHGILSELVPRTRPILQWFFERQFADGFLEKLPYWNAIDAPSGVRDFPRTDPAGRSALMTLLFVDALRDAAELEDAFGDRSLAARYRDMARKSAAAVYAACWNPALGLLADSPEKQSYSQHTNALGILTDAIPVAQQASVIKRILQFKQGEKLGKEPVAMVSYHYQFYLSRAIDRAGEGQLYLQTIAPWRKMLTLGLTTTPEYADPTRSDTHAWSAHPIYDLLTIVAGIHPAAPGFAVVRIDPHPGLLEWFDASIPHPRGTISVRYRRLPNGVKFTLELPAETHGRLDWNGRNYALHAGVQSFTLDLPHEGL
jgi:alpha-L-rhamnosidase